MTRSVWRFVLVALALLAPFLFPYPLSFGLSLLASILFPPAGLMTGLIVDFLYYAPPGIPLGIVLGALASLLGFMVRRFVKARIMG